MNYTTKEAIQQIHASPRTADEERLASDLLAWREIAEKLADVLARMTPLFEHVGDKHLDWCVDRGALEIKQAHTAIAAYEKAVGK